MTPEGLAELRVEATDEVVALPSRELRDAAEWLRRAELARLN
jgi:hypothetical protein